MGVIRINRKTCHAQARRCPNAPRRVGIVYVAALAGNRAQGRLSAGSVIVKCALGPAGTVARKKEGDGATPAGRFRLVSLLYRADRLTRPTALLSVRQVRCQDVWCDDAGDRRYNRPSQRPFGAGHENLWRADGVYNTLIILGYNLKPRIRGRGSAIFFHLARPDYAPTAGCVAISPQDMRKLLPRLSWRCFMKII